MDQHTLSQFYQIIQKDKLSFIFQGEFNDNMTQMITNLSDFNMSKVSEESNLKKKVFYLMVEAFQNVVRHGETGKAPNTEGVANTGLFLTRNVGNAYYIATANLLKNDLVSGMRTKLINVNSVDQERLKELYVQILLTGGLSKKGGAGLGLIDMARKSGEELEYIFEKVDDEYSFFYLQIKIPIPGTKTILNQDSSNNSIFGALDLHKMMLKEDVVLVHYGDFSQGSLLPLLHLIEDTLANQGNGMKLKKKVGLVLIELMQNISKHGKEIDGIASGIFLMGKTDDSYVFGAGNMIENSNIDALKERIEKLNGMNKTEKSSQYKHTLRRGVPTERGGAGLGLLEIARVSNQNLSYDFTSVSDTSSFFTLIVAL